jgi:hypothetical protein
MAWTTPRDWTGITDDIVTAAQLNVDIRDNLTVLSSHSHTGSAGQGASSMSGLTLAALGTLTFANQSANPDAAGELQRNGNDLLFYGSSAVNLTAADASAGTASLRSLGTTSVKAAAGDHTHDVDTPSVSILTGVDVTSVDSNRDYHYKTYTSGQVIDGTERQAVPTDGKNLVVVFYCVATRYADVANIDLQEDGAVIQAGITQRFYERIAGGAVRMTYAADFVERPNETVATHTYKLVADGTVQISAAYLVCASVQTA